MERGVGRARHRAAQSRSFTPVGSSRPAGPSHLWESRSFAPAALSTAAPSHLGESRSFAPAALRMTGSLASLGREGNHPPFLFPFPKRRGVVILSERAERARAKDLLFFAPSPKQVLRACGSFRSAGPSHLWESRSFAPAALS